MPTVETIATGTRCRHNGERDTCPFCATSERLQTGRGTRNVRTSDVLSRAIRATLQRRVNVIRELRGYRFLSDTVSANGATSPVIRAISTSAEYVGFDFYSDLHGETVQRIARYIGNPDNGDVLRRVLTSDGSPVSYVARLASRMARDIATGTGTGRGTMPMFTRDVADVIRALRDKYRVALPDVPAFTIGDVLCPVHAGNGCPLPLWERDGDTGHRERIGDGCTVGTVARLPVLPRRRMSHGERALIVRTFRPERGERSPLFAQWRDGHGDTLPDVRDGHNAGTVAHNVPERDAVPLQRGTLWERFRASGATVADIAALRVAWDVVNVPDKRGRYAKRVKWATVANELGHTGTRDGDTIARNVRAVARTYRARELWDTIRDVPVTVPTVPRPGSGIVPVPTGNVPRNRRTGQPTTRAERARAITGRATVASVPDVSHLHAWHVVSGQWERPANVAPIMSPDVIRDTVPLWTLPPCPCDVQTNAVHVPTCPVRVARARRVALWGTVDVHASPDVIRAHVALPVRDGAHGAT